MDKETGKVVGRAGRSRNLERKPDSVTGTRNQGNALAFPLQAEKSQVPEGPGSDLAWLWDLMSQE